MDVYDFFTKKGNWLVFKCKKNRLNDVLAWMNRIVTQRSKGERTTLTIDNIRTIVLDKRTIM